MFVFLPIQYSKTFGLSQSLINVTAQVLSQIPGVPQGVFCTRVDTKKNTGSSHPVFIARTGRRDNGVDNGRDFNNNNNKVEGISTH